MSTKFFNNTIGNTLFNKFKGQYQDKQSSDGTEERA